MKLEKDKKIDIKGLLKDLENYRPRRKGWHWREGVGKRKIGSFEYREVSENLKNSVPLPAAKYFNNIDPQPDCVITTEIASGRFEDDIRRMRMAAWHGADHMMVIRTAGQSHFDSLIEGTPEGVGGVPITRKQVRATRKALDMIEDEVGRPINFHSYISGVAGPEIAVMFAEEGVNGAHQDPQYNVLYRNVNMIRSFVDAAVAKKVMASAGMAQIDGAHNANATAREAWKVMPELMVQHAINSIFSLKVGIKKENICLSTVPPTAPPAPCMRMDLPYAVALRELFKGFKMRAQMNTRYMESCTREATVTHVLNLMISRLTSADIQSTITPDEGRNVPWHYNNINAVNTAKQALVGMDGLRDMVEIKRDGELGRAVRELKERAVLFMEEILEAGGYFNAVQQGFFVDSGFYPERNGDGIARDINGGIGAGTVVERDEDYMAPVCHHFGYNNLPEGLDKPCSLINECTLCNPEKIVFIDELDENDNVNVRLQETAEITEKGLIKPEVEWCGDGIISMNIFLPAEERTAEFAALEIAKKMGLEDAEVIHKQVMHPAEGTYVEVKGRVAFTIDPKTLKIPEAEEVLSEEEIREYLNKNKVKVVAATVGEDEHSVGMREIIDIKHGGLEKFGFECHYLGTSVPVGKVVDAAIELDADAVLISTIITHADIHRINMQKLNNLCIEKGIRDKVILIGGGTQVTNEIAVESGLDAGFGRGTKGIHVASFLVKKLKEVKAQ
ncbi:D-ornithine 4,5-aminomutase subunit beta [Koleobacter methoxysyntrophicus]|uniref:D-ornithine 4,5-aminomutase subunit beta n=1 Tax=Koleobacter methoxysyntrophicus TaxID=2751313 RepID=A0A8A0RL35_9FIRM|nr:D-ornithine 4,5-aminomutase subunit OraE [Koleobacter methoxysyntrophicus]QSQ08187.1 D-ornithine 4,5-aminomutase subunit beta [Koleobacter methoxysyntrophicus]